jgi:hypothetical protein
MLCGLVTANMAVVKLEDYEMAVSWIIAPRRLVSVYQSFRDPYCDMP